MTWLLPIFLISFSSSPLIVYPALAILAYFLSGDTIVSLLFYSAWITLPLDLPMGLNSCHLFRGTFPEWSNKVVFGSHPILFIIVIFFFPLILLPHLKWSNLFIYLLTFLSHCNVSPLKKELDLFHYWILGSRTFI